ncbi:MAG: glutathione transferase GstA [Vitreimonas sp.]
MKLYYSPGACSLAPHILLREAGVSFDLERVDTKTRKTAAGGDYLAVNPKGYVPALQFDDGEVLTEGVVLQQYIADRNPAARLAPAAGSKERLRLDELLVFLSTEVHKKHDLLFAPTTPEEVKAGLRDKIGQRYDLIEVGLADGRAFLTGANFTVADAYFFTLASWGQYVGIDIARWPNIAALLRRVAARPAVQAALEAEGLKQAA